MIESQTINGRKAVVAYFTDNFAPADRDNYDYAKVIFHDGEMILLSGDTAPAHAEGFNKHRERHRRPYTAPVDDGLEEARHYAKHRMKHQLPVSAATMTDLLPDDVSGEPVTDIAAVPVKLQLVAWAKAIMVLDASEVIVRDVIERDLAGKTGSAAEYRPMKALAIVDKIVADIRVVREDAIKTAFRLLRDRLGDHAIFDTSLAKWAAYFAKLDIQAIDAAIRAGLINGDDNTEIARKVVGSMGLNGVDGVTEYTRHKLAHLGRAAIKDRNYRTSGEGGIE